jgi:AcrR family transcriptional regulator
MTKQRDRFATRAAILESAARLVAVHGVCSLGVNSLANAASCDKVLIYRYFGGLDGVLEALGAERMLWPGVAVDGGDGGASLAESLEAVVLEEWAALGGDALMLQAQVAEAEGANALSLAVATQRRARHADIVATLREKHRVPPYVDLAALLESLSAALPKLALRAGHGDGAPARSGTHADALDARTPQGWRRVEKTLGMVTRALLDS